MTPSQAMADSSVVAAYLELAEVESAEKWCATVVLLILFFMWMMAIGSKDKFNIRLMFVFLIAAVVFQYIQVTQAIKANRATAVYAAEKLAELREKWHDD